MVVSQGGDESDQDEVFFDPELFVNKRIGDLDQPLLSSHAASTDHDLTGQTVWPVSAYLAWFIAHNRHLFEGRRVLELGAGAGLSGLVASRFAASTVLTDGNDIVLELLEQNAERQRKEGLAKGPIHVRKLLWGSAESLDEALDPSLTTDSEGCWTPDVLIGADVVCWPNFIAPLLQTVKHLLLDAQSSDAAFYLGFVSRARATEVQFLTTAAAMGMRVEKIPAESFVLTDEVPRALQSTLELQLLVVRIDQGHPQAMLAPVFELPPEYGDAPC